MQFKRGCSYGIVGISGSGKSTLIDLLTGLYTPDSGTIKIDSLSLSSLNINSWQSSIGYVSQVPCIIDDTIAANVAFGVRPELVDPEQILYSLEMANLSSFIDDLPDGIDTYIGDRGIRMSGGQRQRLCIARAFYQKPNVLILDEATSSLDAISENEIQNAIDSLGTNTTVIIIAHRLGTIRNCDKIFVMEESRVVDEGLFVELSNSSEAFKSLLTSFLDRQPPSSP